MKSCRAFQEWPRVEIRQFETKMAVGEATWIGRWRQLGSNFFPCLALVIRVLGLGEFLYLRFRWVEDRVEVPRSQRLARTGPIGGERPLRGLRPSGCGA